MHSAALAKEPLESLAAADVIALYPAGHMWIARRTNGRKLPRTIKFGPASLPSAFGGAMICSHWSNHQRALRND